MKVGNLFVVVVVDIYAVRHYINTNLLNISTWEKKKLAGQPRKPNSNQNWKVCV